MGMNGWNAYSTVISFLSVSWFGWLMPILNMSITFSLQWNVSALIKKRGCEILGNMSDVTGFIQASNATPTLKHRYNRISFLIPTGIICMIYG